MSQNEKKIAKILKKYGYTIRISDDAFQTKMLFDPKGDSTGFYGCIMAIAEKLWLADRTAPIAQELKPILQADFATPFVWNARKMVNL